MRCSLNEVSSDLSRKLNGFFQGAKKHSGTSLEKRSFSHAEVEKEQRQPSKHRRSVKQMVDTIGLRREQQQWSDLIKKGPTEAKVFILDIQVSLFLL